MKKTIAMGLIVLGCMAATTGIAMSDSFTSAKCSTAGEAAKPAKPQPSASVEKDYYKKLNGRLDTSSLNTDCGTKITAAYDKSWHGHWVDMGVGEPGIASTDQDNCTQMISQVRSRCSKDASKKSISAKIKKIACAYQATPGTKVELKGTTLVGSIGPGSCAADISDPTNKLLDAKL